MNVEINEVQFEHFFKNLAQLPLEEQDENRALKKAANVIIDSIIDEAPKDEREDLNHASLKNNVKSTRPRDGTVRIHSGGAYHAHLVEFGRSGGSKIALKNGKRQKVTWGPTTANPFFTRGFEKAQREALQEMAEEIKRTLGL